MAELKPCDCGCEEVYVDDEIYFEDGYRYWIRCPKCGFESKTYDTPEQAISAWNGRIINEETNS